MDSNHLPQDQCPRILPLSFPNTCKILFCSIEGAPVVQVDPNATEVQIGKEARISCSATGMPAPTIQWKKVGGKLPVHFIENDQLVIPVVTRDDKGEYVCIATNSKGTAEDHVRLRTNGELLAGFFDTFFPQVYDSSVHEMALCFFFFFFF